MNRRPKVSVKKISKADTRRYDYVRPNPGVRTIAAINGRGAYSARKQMSGLSPAQRRTRAKSAVRHATSGASRPQKKGDSSMRRVIRRRSLRANAPHNVRGGRKRWADTKRVRVSVPTSRKKGTAKRRTVSFRVPKSLPKSKVLSEVKMRKNRRSVKRRVARRRPAARRRVSVARKRPAMRRNKRAAVARRRPAVRRRKAVARRRPAAKRRATAKRRVARKRPTMRRNRRRVVARRRKVARKRPVARRRRRLVRNKRRSPVRRRRSAVRRRRPVVRRRRKAVMKRNSRRRVVRRRYRRNTGIVSQVKSWAVTGGFITAGVVGHKLFTGLLKNLLVSKKVDAGVDAGTEAQVENGSAGIGLLPDSMVKHADLIAGGLAAAVGIYATMKMVKKPETRKLVAGGMAASFIHTLIVSLLKKNQDTAKYAASISGLGASATSMSAMYGVGASIQPMYSNIGTGEYFSSGVGEYFSSGVGEYFSSGVNGLGNVPSYEASAGVGEYGGNPDMMQAAAGMGAIDSSNSHHIDPSSDLDRELSIAEAAAGVGSVPMQAAAGLGNVSTVPSSQTWIPGESDPQIWAGTRPVVESQAAHAMVPAGTLTSGGDQGIFG